MTSLVSDKYELPPNGWTSKWENPYEIEERKIAKEKEDLQNLIFGKEKYEKL